MLNPRAILSRHRGALIERAAGEWLCRQGLVMIDHNVQIRGGELDLVMREGDCLVFVEVRHRANSRFGSPAETITITKQRRLIKAARFYLHRNQLSCPCRFDVLAVTGTPPDLEYQWLKNAIEAN